MDRSATLPGSAGSARMWLAHAVQEAAGSLALHQNISLVTFNLWPAL